MRPLTLLLLGLLGWLAACEPVDELPPPGEAPASQATPRAPLTLTTIFEVSDAAAEEWSERARIIELAVDPAGDTPARVVYLASELDRLLTVEVAAGEVLGQQQTTLETLGFADLPDDAITDIPAVDNLPDPQEVVVIADAELRACGLAEVREVVYATGAPAAWDGERWTAIPVWAITLFDGEGRAVRLAADGSAAADPCVELPSDRAGDE